MGTVILILIFFILGQAFQLLIVGFPVVLNSSTFWWAVRPDERKVTYNGWDGTSESIELKYKTSAAIVIVLLMFALPATILAVIGRAIVSLYKWWSELEDVPSKEDAAVFKSDTVKVIDDMGYAHTLDLKVRTPPPPPPKPQRLKILSNTGAK